MGTPKGNAPQVEACPSSSELAKSRARVYGALSMAYARPADERLLELLRSWGELESQLPSGSFPEMMGLGLRRIEGCLEGFGSQASAELLATLSTEHTRLFRGLSRLHSPPPPYESVYVDGGLLYGPSTIKVAREYRRFGLRAHNNEPPDHLAFELDFMRFLCEKESRAWQTEERGQDLLKQENAFLNDHLSRWVPSLCENIRKFDTTGFYEGVAEVTESWICCDREIIKGLTDL